MSALLALERARLAATPGTWFLLALAVAALAWTSLGSVEAVLAAQERLPELPASVTRLLAMPLLARAALIVMVVCALSAGRWWAADRAHGAELLYRAAPLGAASVVAAKWLAAVALGLPVVLVAVAMAGSLRLGAPIDLGSVTAGTIGLVLLLGFGAAIAVAASSVSRGTLAAVALAAGILIVTWAPDAPALARGDLASPLAAVSIARHLDPFLAGEVRATAVGFLLAGTAAALLFAWTMLSRRSPTVRAGLGVAGLMACLLLATVASRLDWRADLSSTGANSFHPETVRILEQAPAGVEVLVPDAEAVPWPAIEAFLDRIRTHYPSLVVERISPAADRGRWEAEGMRPDEILLRREDRSYGVRNLTEVDFMTGFQRLFLDARQRVAYITGTGDRDLRGDANADWGTFGQVLAARGVAPVPLDPVMVPVIPEDLDLLVLAAGRSAPIPGFPEAVVSWLGAGGALWWTIDAGAHAGWAPLFTALGVEQLPGVVVDARAADRGQPDPRHLLIGRFPDHPIGRGLLQPMLVPRAGALVAASDRWTPAVVLESTGTSWNETGPLAGAIEPDAEGERPGPLPLMLALERDRGGAVQRAVVAGDGDFLANAFLGNGANQDLGLRTVWWLLEGAGLVELPARLAPDLWLDLPRRRLALLGIAWLLLMPAALAAVGWRARRRLRRA